MRKPLRDLPTNLFVKYCKHNYETTNLEDFVNNMQESVNNYADRALKTSVEMWARENKTIVLRNERGEAFFELRGEKEMDVWKRCINSSTHFLVDEEIDVEWYAHGTFGTIKSTQFLNMSYSDFVMYLEERGD